MISKQTRKSGMKGFSLLELLLVVAVGAVLILAGLGAYRLVSENNNTNQASRQLATLKQQVQQTFQGQTGYPATANLLTTMNSLKAVPSDMAIVGLAAGTLKGALGTVTLASPAANSTTFTITMAGVPRSACVKLAQSFNQDNSSDTTGVSIGGTAIASGGFTQTALSASCAAAGNAMIWTFQ
ncbi:MAG: prepilin-type N-terminal cleavage/methylation domain-containing protein [Rhodospirillales bacterium]|nr:prepilin-type N-terminal cleavage/methylation domain-containing protein [Alphaproteobacteria bacterium]MCB9986583.1 prepilin-type N-terminal cleavage/methylation domain-containing protein [Rhodospirillales bacterium]USO08598.1 MAG: prepilin-type N-terminal cleavage/methylation domain-containing protein [Rhodospirillales bacterium]